MRLGSPEWLHGLWCVPVLIALCAYVVRRRARSVRLFAEPALLEEMGVGVGVGRVVLKHGLVGLALVCGVIGLARPQWNPQERTVSASGRDVVFVVDVSRSMLARDVAPSRLERTKIWIRDLSGSLEGDRVGLVAFAGAASVVCPLTTDYAFFDLALDGLDTQSVSRGGTNIGDAIRKTLESVFVDDGDGEGRSTTAYRDIILFTDGEDQGSFPVAAAERAGRAGVRIIALGLGSTGEGSRIVLNEDGTALRDRTGEVVRSSLDSETLIGVANASAGGRYLEIGTGTIDLAEVYNDLVRSAEQGETEQSRAVRYDEGFGYFLLVCVGLLLLEGFIRD